MDNTRIKKISKVYDALYDCASKGGHANFFGDMMDSIEEMMKNQGYELKLNRKTQKWRFIEMR